MILRLKNSGYNPCLITKPKHSIMKESGENDLNRSEKIQIPVIAEVLKIKTITKPNARVQVKKEITEQLIEESILLEEEDLEVKQVAVNKFITEVPPAIRQDSNTTIISVIKEVLVVEKKLMLVEEIHITKTKKQTKTEVSEIVRTEEAKITKT
jgi:stress response protein YsnF